MDRLTSRSEVSGIMLVRGHGLGPAYFDTKRDYKIYCEAIDRLAAYEDTGYTPAEIADLAVEKATAETIVKQYEEWEQDGTIIRLPCKVGDTVYFTRGHAVCSEKVRTFFLGHPSYRVEQRNMRMMRLESHDVPFDQLGKTVFRSYEEAEAALGGTANE